MIRLRFLNAACGASEHGLAEESAFPGGDFHENSDRRRARSRREQRDTLEVFIASGVGNATKCREAEERTRHPPPEESRLRTRRSELLQGKLPDGEESTVTAAREALRARCPWMNVNTP